MAETRLIGFDGSVTMPTGHGGRIKNWTGRAEVVNTDTSAFGDTFAQNRNGLIRMSGSASGTLYKGVSDSGPGITTALLQPSSIGSITLTASTGCTISGSANITGIALSSEHQGDATISFDFVFTGTITQTWATS